MPPATPTVSLSNADIAHQLITLAQLLAVSGENPFKIKAYRRAAETVQSLADSVSELVRQNADLTAFSGIGKGIASAIREIVLSGGLRLADRLRSAVTPEIAAMSEFPRLDPRRVQQIYAKLGIATVASLREKLDAGEIGRVMGPRVEHHVRQALITSQEILLFDADDTAEAVRDFLLRRAGARRAEVAGDFRRRVEVIRELAFVVIADDFAALVTAMEHYGGRTEVVTATAERATFRLPVGLLVTVEATTPARWGLALVQATGSEAHLTALDALPARAKARPTAAAAAASASTRGSLASLARSRARFPTEASVYRALGLAVPPPEVREGHDEVALAGQARFPRLVTLADLCGDLHLHTTASDGAHSLERMVEMARERGYAYLGVTDHSQSLKIARGLSEDALREQIRRVDGLNARLKGFRVLKSAEVDILTDGKLDYPDELLRELDYTVCSIHSRFGLNREQQTERILRAMDNPCFTLLGHATGRLLLRRPGYQIDIERVLAHAKDRGCFFEINSSPDRLDLSAAHARLAREAGIKIALNTDAHSTSELDFMRCGVDVARRAGLRRTDVLNTRPLPELMRLLRG